MYIGLIFICIMFICVCMCKCGDVYLTYVYSYVQLYAAHLQFSGMQNTSFNMHIYVTFKCITHLQYVFDQIDIGT
jgi:hypothetical protein